MGASVRYARGATREDGTGAWGGRAGKSRGGNVVFLLPQDEMLMFHFQKGRSLLGNPIVPCREDQHSFWGTVLIALPAFSLGRQTQLRSSATAEITCKNILPVQADWCKEGAEEDPSVWVALPGQQGQPAGRLLDYFWHGLVLQQVGNPHLGVTNVIAQGHVVRNGCAAGGSPQVACPGSWRAPEQQACQETQQPWAS